VSNKAIHYVRFRQEAVSVSNRTMHDAPCQSTGTVFHQMCCCAQGLLSAAAYRRRLRPGRRGRSSGACGELFCGTCVVDAAKLAEPFPPCWLRNVSRSTSMHIASFPSTAEHPAVTQLGGQPGHAPASVRRCALSSLAQPQPDSVLLRACIGQACSTAAPLDGCIYPTQSHIMCPCGAR
jgi:hypothetical protein